MTSAARSSPRTHYVNYYDALSTLEHETVFNLARLKMKTKGHFMHPSIHFPMTKRGTPLYITKCESVIARWHTAFWRKVVKENKYRKKEHHSQTHTHPSLQHRYRAFSVSYILIRKSTHARTNEMRLMPGGEWQPLA